MILQIMHTTFAIHYFADLLKVEKLCIQGGPLYDFVTLQILRDKGIRNSILGSLYKRIANLLSH